MPGQQCPVPRHRNACLRLVHHNAFEAQLDNLRNFVVPNYDIASFSFTDTNGLVINPYNSILTNEFFMISTDAKGQILSGPPPGNRLVDWAFSLTSSNGEMGAATIGEDFS
jgi:hypothetical protein